MLEWIEEIECEIDKLKENEYGFIVTKTIARGVLCANIVIPQETFGKELTEDEIEFKLVIDTFSLKLTPKLYCLTPYCFPHLADGRDLYKELRNSKIKSSGLSFDNLLSDIIEFIKINFERGGLIFCGNYYLGEKYDLKILQKGCENIINVKQNLVINGKKIRYNRVLVLSDVFFLLFEQEKWSKNNLTLLFWSSINNIEKIQKVNDNKTLILNWTTKEKYNTYLMSLTINNRESFIQDLLEKMKTFGMNFDIMKINKNNEIEHNSFSSEGKFRKKSSDEQIDSQNVKLINIMRSKKKEKEKEKEEEEEGEEDEEEEEGEEEEDDDEQEKKEEKKEENNKKKNEKDIKGEDKKIQEKNKENKNKKDSDKEKETNNKEGIKIEDNKKGEEIKDVINNEENKNERNNE